MTTSVIDSKIVGFAVEGEVTDHIADSKIVGFSAISPPNNHIQDTKIVAYAVIGEAEPLVGQIIQVRCGKIRITEVVSAVEVRGVVITPLDIREPDQPEGGIENLPIAEGDWTTTTPVSTLSGLDHLEGKAVSALADGLVVHGLTVTAGSVTLPFAASNIVVGLDYVGQIQTLYLNVDGLQQGSMQGNRKFLPGATLRVECTRGLSMGPDFDHLVTPPELLQQGSSVALYTGDAYAPISPDWNTRGEICVQQSDPLPATVLGIVVKVVPGDTGH